MTMLYRLENPIPIPALKYINTYILDCDDQSIIVDPGMTRQCGESVTRFIEEKKLPKNKIVLLTHFHVDHVAATPLLDPEIVYMHDADLNHVKRMVDEWPLVLEVMKETFLKGGMPHREVDLLEKKHPAMSRIEVFKQLRELDPEPAPEHMDIGSCSLSTIHLPGHTPGSMAIDLGGGEYIVGDTVLGDITPNIALIDWNTNPLRDYLGSLRKLLSLKPRRLYPGHRSIIENPKERIMELLRHHNRRLSEVLTILSKSGRPLTAYQVASMMEWDVSYSEWSEFPIAQKYFALGEALSHLKYLLVKGLVTVEEADDVFLFSVKQG